MGLLKNDVGRPSNKTKRMRNIIKISVALIIIAVIVLSIFGIKSGIELITMFRNGSNNMFAQKVNPTEATKDKVNEVRDAVLRTANAYYKQGTQVQYDSYRRNLSCTPEDATSKHYCYVNCSGFVHMVYKNAINKEVPDTTAGLFELAACKRSNFNSNTKVNGEKVDCTNYKNLQHNTMLIATKDENYGQHRLGYFLKQNISNIKPGDVIVWKTNSAHTMLVESADEKNNEIHIIQAGGGAKETEGRYDVANSKDVHEENGTLSKEIIKIVDGVAMIGSTEIKREEAVILRFATSYDYENITGASKIRKDFENIYVAKVASSDNQNFVRKDETITYTLKVKNNSKDKIYRDIAIKENIDEKKVAVKSITFKNETKDYVNYESESKHIIRNISVLKPGEEVTLKYTVQVKAPVGNIIVSTGIVGKTKQDGDIYGIKTSRIETLVGNGLTSTEKKCLKDKIEKVNETDSREFINKLYSEVLGIELNIPNNKNKTNNEKITNFNKSIFNYNSEIGANKDTNNLFVNYTKFIENKDKNKDKNKKDLKDYLYSNYYGLRLADSSSSINGTIKDSLSWNQNTSYELYDRARTLTPNMLEDGDIVLTETEGYIYFEPTKSEGSKLCKYGSKKEKITGKNLEDFLRDLLGRNYIVLRPYGGKCK